MMIFTCSDFELDLSVHRVSFQITNSWFEDALFSLISFPIDLPIEGFFENYRYHNEEVYPSKFEGILNWKGKLSQSVMEITDIDESFVRVTFETGLEAFPVWDVMLADLPLENKTVPNIREHANEILDKKWPEVNYNFPMIHAPNYDVKNDVWKHFEGIYNKRVGGNFIENSIDEANNVVYNRNIMRPMVYGLHILKTGIEAAGFTLHGDILEDEDCLIMMHPPSIPIEIKDRPESVEWLPGPGTEVSNNYGTIVFESRQQILHYGKFRIKGFVKGPELKSNNYYPFLFSFNDVIIYEGRVKAKGKTEVDFIINTNIGEDYLKLGGVRANYQNETGELEIIPMKLYEDDGTEKKFLADSNVIDLRYHVPECTFGDFVNYYRNQKNFSFDLMNGNEIHMNKKEAEVLPTNAIDLREFEVQFPRRTLNPNESFLIKYRDFSSEDYPNQEVYFDDFGIKMTDYMTNDDTIELEIGGIPLPVETRNNITTSVLFSSDASAINTVLYPGLNGGENTTQNINHFQLPAIIDNYYKKWLRFQLNTVLYSWTFTKSISSDIDFNINDKIYAYKNYHFIKNMSITRVSPIMEEYEIQTYTIRSSSII
ncbi:hypothetical protein QP519_03125 [Weeksella virosa]|uniref:hypothetical protein n=1 Tax=Weeksella virosa TaxID=1014 RepID=UPI00255704B1|nr:hypothetical protein [Weeksella virosa]MDK7374529.1 hypothetical protein [Weeksella virosa]